MDFYFNPLAPQGSKTEEIINGYGFLFQSTCSAREQDKWSVEVSKLRDYFNPLAPQGSKTGLMFNSLNQFWDFNPLAPQGSKTQG